MPVAERFIHQLMHRRGCTFQQRFVRLLIITGPLLVALEVLGSGVLKEPSVLPWFLVFTIPGTLLFVLIETAFAASGF
jgi:hypothetical protein